MVSGACTPDGIQFRGRWHALDAAIVVLTALSLLLGGAGCSAVHLTPEARAAITTVGVNPHVEMPTTIDTHDASMVLTFGIVGAIVDDISSQRQGRDLGTAMAAEGIDLGMIVYQTFLTRLAASRAFVIAQPDQNAALLTLRVAVLGLGRPMGFTDRLKPMVNIQATLTAADGIIVWRQTDYVTNMSDQTPSFLYAEYVDHPENIRTAFTRAFEIIADNLVANLTAAD